MTTKETTTPSGNTIATSSDEYRKGRNFHITAQESQYDMINTFVNYVESLKCFQYILICEHDKEDNGEVKKHRHIYIQLNECRVLSKKYLNTLHCEKCLGSAQQNVTYLKAEDSKHKRLGVKSEVIYENGEMKKRGGKPATVKEALTIADEDMSEIDPQYYNTIKRIKTDYANKPVQFTSRYKPDVEVIYVCGKSDKAKTKWVYDFFKKMKNEPLTDLVKCDGKYWTGFNDGIEWAVYEEWRDNHMKPSEFINFIDYYKQNMRVLYGFKNNNYNHILITTIQDLKEVYNGSHEDPKQWYKRITKYINLNTGEEMTGREKYEQDYSEIEL